MLSHRSACCEIALGRFRRATRVGIYSLFIVAHKDGLVPIERQRRDRTDRLVPFGLAKAPERAHVQPGTSAQTDYLCIDQALIECGGARNELSLGRVARF